MPEAHGAEEIEDLRQRGLPGDGVRTGIHEHRQILDGMKRERGNGFPITIVCIYIPLASYALSHQVSLKRCLSSEDTQLSFERE